MPRVSTKFEVTGIEPADPLWRSAPEPVRRDFWRQVVVLVKEEYEFERARGRDRFGRKLAAITRFTRANRRSATGAADANAPPLTPADAASRTVAYFDGRAFSDRAEFFWRNGWGRILGFHRVGARNKWAKGGRLPVRDVIGISERSEAKVRREALKWWEDWKRGQAKPEPTPTPVPRTAGPKVVYVSKPTRPSTKIQIYTTPEPRPKPRPVPARPRVDLPKTPAVLRVPVPLPVAAKPKPVPVPRSEPLRNFFTVEAQGELGKTAGNAIDQIAKVHGVTNAIKVPVVSHPVLGSNGQYMVDHSGPLAIGVNPSALAPGSTTLHEVGHYLEMSVMAGNRHGLRKIEEDPLMKEWLAAVRGTDTYAKLSGQAKGDRYVEYVLTPRELWARTYSQYIAVRSKDPALLAELDSTRRGQIKLPTQWPDAEFEPVARELDALFTKLGWRP